MLKIQLAQFNFCTGDIKANATKIIDAILQSNKSKADILVFPELALTGYPPEDLLLRNDFFQQIHDSLQDIKKVVTNCTVILGYPHKSNNALYNAAAVLHQGKQIHTYFKQCLPNYGVFDEKRYFTPGEKPLIFPVNNVNISIVICEDLWQAKPMQQSYNAGADIIISLNASPFDYAKPQQRYEVLRARQSEHALPIIYVNMIGGQDELIFAGGSLVLATNGDVIAQGQYFKEQTLTVQLDNDQQLIASEVAHTPIPSEEALIYNALVLATRDYLEKNHFSGAVLGLSGGIDSALTLAIAVDAIGAKNVQAVMMPSRYTADMSQDDAAAEAEILGVGYSVLAIEKSFTAFLETLSGEFSGLATDTTEENIQARCRGILLMAISNKTGRLVLTTGNKSEMSVGYATLYGDMAGGFAVLKDVPKTLVFRLAHYRNTISPVIPQRVIDRPPSAELAPEQIDEDSLPPYSILDAILERFVERDQSISEIVAAGFEQETVEKIVAMVKRNEYKRRQAAPGPRVTPRAYGRDRRYPITSGF